MMVVREPGLSVWTIGSDRRSERREIRLDRRQKQRLRPAHGNQAIAYSRIAVAQHAITGPADHRVKDGFHLDDGGGVVSDVDGSIDPHGWAGWHAYVATSAQGRGHQHLVHRVKFENLRHVEPSREIAVAPPILDQPFAGKARQRLSDRRRTQAKAARQVSDQQLMAGRIATPSQALADGGQRRTERISLPHHATSHWIVVEQRRRPSGNFSHRNPVTSIGATRPVRVYIDISGDHRSNA